MRERSNSIFRLFNDAMSELKYWLNEWWWWWEMGEEIGGRNRLEMKQREALDLMTWGSVKSTRENVRKLDGVYQKIGIIICPNQHYSDFYLTLLRFGGAVSAAWKKHNNLDEVLCFFDGLFPGVFEVGVILIFSWYFHFLLEWSHAPAVELIEPTSWNPVAFLYLLSCQCCSFCIILAFDFFLLPFSSRLTKDQKSQRKKKTNRWISMNS